MMTSFKSPPDVELISELLGNGHAEKCVSRATARSSDCDCGYELRLTAAARIGMLSTRIAALDDEVAELKRRIRVGSG